MKSGRGQKVQARIMYSWFGASTMSLSTISHINNINNITICNLEKQCRNNHEDWAVTWVTVGTGSNLTRCASTYQPRLFNPSTMQLTHTITLPAANIVVTR